MIFICATTFRDANQIARKLHLGWEEWRYVDSDDKIRGTTGGTFIVTETAHLLRDYPLILQQAQLRGMEIQYRSQ